MERKPIPFAVRLGISGLFLALATSAGAASITLAQFDFDDPEGEFDVSPSVLADGIAARPWTDLAGSLTDFSGNPGRALAARDFASGNALELELELAAGSHLSLSSISFDERASASGAQLWVLAVNDTLFATGNTSINSFGSHTINLGDLLLTDAAVISLRGSDASSDSGTWRIDNFQLQGEISAVPVPAAGLLMPAALLLLGIGRHTSG